MNRIEMSKELFRLLTENYNALDEMDIMDIRDFFVLETIILIQSRDSKEIYEYSELLNEFYTKMRDPKLRLDSFNSLFDGYHGCLKLNAFFFYLLESILILCLDMEDYESRNRFQKSLSNLFNKS